MYKNMFVRRTFMTRFFMMLLFGVFLIYITVYSYKFIRYRKTGKNVVKFMTSSIILFTLTVVCYKDIYFKENDSKGWYEELSTKGESKVFLSRDAAERPIFPFQDYDKNETGKANNQEIEVKISAYFDNASPAKGAITNLIVSGPPKGKVTAICQYKGHGTPYIMDIGVNGKAFIPVRVENDAEPGLMVVVDVVVSYEGKLYKTNSVFTPQ
jgi:hypothetical protein